jgi:predicted extracellular nuclease
MNHARRSSIAVLLCLFASLIASSFESGSRAASLDVVISQIYGGGGNSGAPLSNDFIELHNLTDFAVSVEGWSVQYASATGSGNLGATATQITELTGTIAPHGYLLVEEAGGATGSPLPTPDVTDATPIALAAGAGKVALVRNRTPLGCNGSVAQPCSATAVAAIVDLVGYGNANFFEGSGAAPTLSNTTAAIRGNDGATDTDNNDDDFTSGAPAPRNGGFTPPPPPPGGCAVAPSHDISAVQGEGASTPLAGQTVRVEGIVTGDFQGPGQLGGFYVQDDTADADPNTSEGLFAFASATFADVQVGQRVRVTGRAIEFNGLTELSPVQVVDVCGTGTISPLSVDLPRAPGTTFEPFENMLVIFPDELSATEHFELGRFGEVTLSVDGRLLQPTDRVAPGAAAAAFQDLNNRRSLLIDDGSSAQNPPTVPFVSPGNTLRLGDTTTGVTGVLTFGFGQYRLEPTQEIVFTRTPRPEAPAPVGGDIRVASFNTLNYFTTLTSVNPNARGADTAEEFTRQQGKEVSAIRGLDADVIGLMEVENNGPTAIGSLVAALNASGAGPYAVITEPALNAPNEFGGTFGADAIKVAIIYKPSKIMPVGEALSSSDTVFARPPLIQTFQRAGGNSESFTLVVNHFKSKGCDGATGADLDQGDGQSCFTATRVSQANTLTSLLASLALNNVLIVGDLNSYTEEDPIHTLETAGFTGLSELYVADAERYSFVFDRLSGELDHALAAPDLLDNVTGATIWHINADEPLILDYNTEFNPPGLYAPDAYRTSDHDPILVGLTLNAAPSVDAGGPYSAVEGKTVTLAASGNDPEGALLSYDWDLDGDGIFETPGQSVTFSASGLDAPATRTVSVRVTDDFGNTAVDTASVDVIWNFTGFLSEHLAEFRFVK